MAQSLAALGKGRRDVAITIQEADLREGKTGSVDLTEVKVPDIGDFKDVPIIEVHVKKGDAVNADDPLITLESDKASMEVPAPIAGTVQELYVTVGDRVSEGRPILALKAGDGALAEPPSLVGQQEPPLAARISAKGCHPGQSSHGKGPCDARMFARRRHSRRHAERGRVRGMPQIRRGLGAPAHVPAVRRHALLRLVAEPSCQQARARHEASTR